MKRRDWIKGIGAGAVISGAGGAGVGGAVGLAQDASAQTYASATRGLAPLKITRVRAIATNPQGQRLVVVKVETTEPGLYGLGCATYNQRPLAVIEAVDRYLDPFPEHPGYWHPIRRGDGTSIRP